MAGIRKTPDSNLQTVTINYSSSATGQNPQLQIINSPGGGATQIQYNDGNGKFAGSPNMIWNNTNRILNVLGTIRASNLQGKLTTNLTNFKLTGGNVGDTLTTDGTGNLSWVEGENYGNSNVANYLPNYSGNINSANINISNTIYTGNVSVTGAAFLTTVSVNSTMNTRSITANGNVTANFFIGNGSQLTGFANVAFTGNYTNLTGRPTNVSAFTNDAGYITVSTANVVSVNGLTGAVTISDVATANYANYSNVAYSVDLANVVSIGNIANINLDGNASNILFGNGAFAELSIPEVYGNSNVANYLPTYTGNLSNIGSIVAYNSSPAPSISGFSSVSAVRLSGEGGNISNIQAANVSGLGNISTINLDGNTSNILYGNGVFSAAPIANTGNFTFSNNDINTASNASNITLNITGTGAKTWIFANTGDFYSPGNVQGGNFTGTGNLVFNNWANTPGGTNMILNPGTSQLRIIANTEPYHDNSWRLGSSSARWSTVFANAGNFSGTLSVSGNANVANLGATTVQLTGTGTAVNASQGNILTNQVTGTHFNFMSGLYTASLTGSGTLAANYTLYLPSDAGSNGQLLTSNGSGGLSWTTVSAGSSYSNANATSLLASFGSNTLNTTGNVTAGNLITSGNLNLSSNLGNVVFSTGAYITGNAIGREGSILLQPYTGAGSLFPGVKIGGAGRIIAPNDSVSIVLNASDITAQLPIKAPAYSASSTTSGGIQVTGGGGIGVTGNIYVGGNSVTGNNAIVAGVTGTLLPNSTASFFANSNSYTQITYQNKSNGSDATADFIVTADNGTDTVNYLDLGIINSGYDNGTPTNSLGNIVYAADSYLYSQGNVSNTSQSGGNLVLGATTPAKTVKIFAGGVNSNSIIATFSNTGVSVNGNVTANNFSGNINITGNVIGTSPNVTLVAGSYSYKFDNTGVLTLPAGPGSGGGDEGGEIDFTKAPNSTLSGNFVAVDQYIDRIRFFESGGTNRGAYIDLTQAAAGVGTLLNNRVSGIVNSGVFVTMDLLKVQLTSSGNRGLSIASTTGTFTVNIGATYSTASGSTAGSAAVVVVTTTSSASLFSWNFTGQADTSTYIITDTTNNRSYRVILQIGGSFLNNMISIERLV